MDATNMVAQDVETHGVRTFSAKEMSFNILGLMHPLLFSITQVEPIWADLSGGMDRVADLADITTRIRTTINKTAELRRAIARDNAAEFKTINGVEAERVLQTVNVTPRANFRYEFPELETVQSLEDLAQLRDVIDLEKVVVITGYGEVGPWGSSRTRWEMEARGELTLEGCIEMAWMMGYIKHFDGRLKDGKLYVGWVDAKSGEPVDDKDVKGKYQEDIVAHSGVRLIGSSIALARVTLLTRFLRARALPRLRPEPQDLQPRDRAHPRPRAARGVSDGSRSLQARAWRALRHLGG
jgi:fatty acid synthase subunit alpha